MAQAIFVLILATIVFAGGEAAGDNNAGDNNAGDNNAGDMEAITLAIAGTTSIRLHHAKNKLRILLSCFGENGASMEVCEALKGAVCECRSLGLPTKDLMEAREWLIAAVLERCGCGDCKSCTQNMSLAELRVKLRAEEARERNIARKRKRAMLMKKY